MHAHASYQAPRHMPLVTTPQLRIVTHEGRQLAVDALPLPLMPPPRPPTPSPPSSPAVKGGSPTQQPQCPPLPCFQLVSG